MYVTYITNQDEDYGVFVIQDSDDQVQTQRVISERHKEFALIVLCRPDIDRAKVPLKANTNVYYVMERDLNNSLEPIIYKLIAQILNKMDMETKSLLSMSECAYCLSVL